MVGVPFSSSDWLASFPRQKISSHCGICPRLDYYGALRSPLNGIWKLHLVQNAADMVLTEMGSVLAHLLWLQICFWVQEVCCCPLKPHTTWDQHWLLFYEPTSQSLQDPASRCPCLLRLDRWQCLLIHGAKVLSSLPRETCLFLILLPSASG